MNTSPRLAFKNPQFIRPLVQLAAALGDLDADLDADLADLPGIAATLNSALDAVDAALDAGLADLPGIVGIAGIVGLDADSTGTLTIGDREIELKVHDVSVSRGEVLLWTDKGTVTLVVDRYGDRLTWEVFDWDLEDCPKPISEKEKAILMAASEKLRKLDSEFESKLDGWYIDEDGALCIPNEDPNGPEWNYLGIEIKDGEVNT